MRLPQADIAIIDRASRLPGRSAFNAFAAAITALAQAVPEMVERRVEGAQLVGGRALVVNALDDMAARFWGRRRFIPSRDDPLILFRSIADIAAPVSILTCQPSQFW